MKTKRKYFFLFLLFGIFSHNLSIAQNKINFVYDACGNRIQRSLEMPEEELAMLLFDKITTEETDSAIIEISTDRKAETINIKFKSKATEQSSVGNYILYNSGGKIINKTTSLKNEFLIELSSYPRGIYILYVNCNGKKKCHKIRLN